MHWSVVSNPRSNYNVLNLNRCFQWPYQGPIQSSIYEMSACLILAIKVLSYFKSLYQLHLIAYCVKKSKLNFSSVLEDGLLGKDIVISPKKDFASPCLKISFSVCLSKRQAGQVLAKSLALSYILSVQNALNEGY